MRYVWYALVLLTVACAQTTQSPPPAEVPVAAPETNGYFSFSDGKAHADTDGPAVGLHVRGIIDGDRFNAIGDVVGEGAIGGAGSPGWMELADGSFHGQQTGRPPFPPWVEGVMTDDGFVPSTRTVNY